MLQAKEQMALTRMESALSDIDRLLDENAAKQSKVKEDTKRINNEIEQTFKGTAGPMVTNCQFELA